MSYSLNLYNNIETVLNNFNNRAKEIKDFTELLKTQYDHNIEYATSLKKISEFGQKVLPNYSLSDSFYIYRQSITNHHNYMIEFLERYKDGMLQPLIKFRDFHKKIGTSLNFDIKKNEKMYYDSLDKLEKAKLRYFSCNKTLDEHRMKYEQSKFNQNINSEQRNKLFQKSEISAHEVKESEQSYLKQLEITNRDRENFIETNQKILNEFQQLQFNYNKTLKDSFIKLNQFQITFSNCLHNDLLNQLKVFENIDIEGDIDKFINSNEKPFNVPTKLEFIDYIPETPSKSQQTKPSFLDFLFGKEKKNMEIEIEDRFSLEITSLTNSIWEGKLLTNEQIDNFMKLMKEKRCRKFFIVTLSKFRIKGLFTIEEKSFYQLGEVLIRVLNEVYINKDYEAFKSFLILSQTYYKKQENNEEKEFIQNLFETHEICRDVEFWEEIIKYSIFEEYSNQHDLPVYSSDSPHEMKIRHQNLVFGQLVSYSYNILTFGLSKEKVKLVIEKFTNYYELSEEFKLMLNMNIDEFVLPESKKEKLEKIMNAESDENKQNLDSSSEYVVI